VVPGAVGVEQIKDSRPIVRHGVIRKNSGLRVVREGSKEGAETCSFQSKNVCEIIRLFSIRYSAIALMIHVSSDSLCKSSMSSGSAIGSL